MRQLLGLLACSLLVPALLITACGDDSSESDGGGQGGLAGAGETAGEGGLGDPVDGAGGLAGASGNGIAGAGGVAGSGGSGAAGEGFGGAARSEGGEGGGAGEGGARASAGGAGGAAGHGAEDGCLGSALPNRLCAAFEARACEQAVNCVACVQDAKAQRAPYEGCGACASAFDSWHQCAVSAFVGGNVSEGVECVDGYAEVHGDNCAGYLGSAIECSVVAGSEGCPATWPE